MSWRPEGYGAWWAWASLVVMPACWLLIHFSLGLRPEHHFFVLTFLVLAWAGPRARRFSALGAPLVITGLSYDFLRLFMHLRGEVHVADLWNAERLLFPFPTAEGTVALADVVAAHTHPILDVITGVVYILYLPQAILVATYLFFRSHRQMAVLAWSFTLISVLGWGTWIVWPAAPPWYVDVYGLGPAVLDAAPSAAGAARFDALFGITLFSEFYSRSSNVFGAMPSLHVGYAVVVAAACYPLGGKLRIWTIAFALVMAFGAVYLRHHYILDVVAGLVFALIANRAVEWGVARVFRASPSASLALGDEPLESAEPTAETA